MDGFLRQWGRGVVVVDRVYYNYNICGSNTHISHFM